MMPRLAVYHLRDRLNAGVAALGVTPFLLGECFTGGQLGRETIRWYLGPQGLDSLFDFPLMWSLQSILGKGEGSLADLDAEMTQSELAYDAPGAVMGLFVDNHDIPRFISIAAGDDVSDAFNPPDQPSVTTPYRRLMIGSDRGLHPARRPDSLLRRRSWPCGSRRPRTTGGPLPP